MPRMLPTSRRAAMWQMFLAWAAPRSEEQGAAAVRGELESEARAPESEEQGSAAAVRGELESEGAGRADRVDSARAGPVAAGLGGPESEARAPESEEQGPAAAVREA
jgi:hypothetical protein